MFNNSSVPPPPRPPPPRPVVNAAAGQFPPSLLWHNSNSQQQYNNIHRADGSVAAGMDFGGMMPPAFHFPKPTFSYPLNNGNHQHQFQSPHQHYYPHQYPTLNVPSMHNSSSSGRLGHSLSQGLPHASPHTSRHKQLQPPTPYCPKEPTLPRTTAPAPPPAGAAPGTHKEEQLRCDPCDKTFSNQTAFNAHLSTHDKCSACDFVGSKKVVSVHFQLTHGTFSGTGYKQIEVEGLRFKVLMGTDSQEVAEWREQRRRKFPTKQTCADKQAREQQLLQAGGLGEEEGCVGGGSAAAGGQQAKRALVLAAAESSSSAMPAHKRPKLHGDSSADSSLPSAPLVASSTSTSSSTSSSSSDHLRGGVVAGGPAFGEDSSSAGPKKVCLAFQKKGRCKFGSRCHFAHAASASPLGDGRPGKKKLSAKKTAAGTSSAGELGSLHGKMVRQEADEEDNIILQCFRYFVQTDFAMGVEISEGIISTNDERAG